jgi:hypothetical protein
VHQQVPGWRHLRNGLPRCHLSLQLLRGNRGGLHLPVHPLRQPPGVRAQRRVLRLYRMATQAPASAAAANWLMRVQLIDEFCQW